MSDNILTVACLGAGYFSRFHYQAWQRLPNVVLFGACDQDLARAQATGAPPFTSLQAMLEANKPDILDIITPPETHVSAIEQAVDAGVQTIICQKPFCQSLQEATRAVVAVDASDSTLVIHENFRFQPWFRVIAKTLNEGRLGSVQQGTFRLRTGDGQGPQAYMDRQPYFQTMPRLLIHETGVHYIDTFQYLFGPVLSVYADLRRLNPAIVGEDAGYIIFEFADSVRALFDGNRHLDHASQNTRLTFGEALIEGTQGTLSLFGDGRVEHRAFGDLSVTTLLAEQAWCGFAGDSVHALQAHVVSHLLHGSVLENTGGEYLKTLNIEAQVYRSAHEQRRIILSSPADSSG